MVYTTYLSIHGEIGYVYYCFTNIITIVNGVY